MTAASIPYPLLTLADVDELPSIVFPYKRQSVADARNRQFENVRRCCQALLDGVSTRLRRRGMRVTAQCDDDGDGCSTRLHWLSLGRLAADAFNAPGPFPARIPGDGVVGRVGCGRRSTNGLGLRLPFMENVDVPACLADDSGFLRVADMTAG